MMKRIACLLLVLLPTYTYSTTFEDSLFDPPEKASQTGPKIKQTDSLFLPIPTIITEPAIGGGLALSGLYFHPTQKKETGPTMPENISIAGLMATKNGTKGGVLGHAGYWRDDTVRYLGLIGYADIHLNFYSLAGRELNNPIQLGLEGPGLFQKLLFSAQNSKVYYGVKQLYRRVDISILSLGFSPAIDQEISSRPLQTVATSGIGGLIEYDTRNNPFDPTQGIYLHSDYVFFDDALGSDVDYRSAQLEAQFYQKFGAFGAAARVQYDGVFSANPLQLPVYVRPSIDLRGVAKARYQGLDVINFELEGYYQLNTHWRVNVFTGLGRAAEGWSSIDDARSITTVGAGFRYILTESYNIALGVDLARGPDEDAIYVQVGGSW